MNSEPLVSIVLTVLNSAVYLRQAVDSCLTQTYSNIELIVVDGGSADGTLEILDTYSGSLRLIHQPNNAGKLPGAINLGLDHSKGKYLTWMQGDSVYHPQAIEKMVRCLESNPNVGQVYADFWEIDSDGKITGIQHPLEPQEFLAARGDPAGVCFLIRRSVRDAVGPHDVTTHPVHDADYRWRIALRFSSLHIREPLYYWRLHPLSLTGSRPWVALARESVYVRQKLGLLTPQQARAELGDFDIAFAFDRYQAGSLEQVPALVLSGLRRCPHFVFNRGVWSILFKSLVRRPLFFQTNRSHA